jgi:o-succinylbenzoate synthase
MALIAQYYKHTLNFRFDAGTSRGVLKNKDSYFLKISEKNTPNIFGLGEIAPLEGLSIDFVPELLPKIFIVVSDINTGKLSLNNYENYINDLKEFPSIVFGIETAFLDFKNGGKRLIFNNNFYNKGSEIKINGLVWMGSHQFMQEQINEKISEGFDTIKMKIGAIDFKQELDLLKSIRKKYDVNKIKLRLDANGAFNINEAEEKLRILSEYDIHSIEQPIKQGQPTEMRILCENSPVSIALDEELIANYDKKEELLKQIMPQYIILKPTLHGGISGTKAWIIEAEKLGIKWWITSALESNIGLNAICQLCAEYENQLPQGLGTGKLYDNNFESPLVIKNGKIGYDKSINWQLEL